MQNPALITLQIVLQQGISVVNFEDLFVVLQGEEPELNQFVLRTAVACCRVC